PVVGTRRGPERIGPLELTETDGLGLARRRRRVGSPTPVMVTPRIVPLAPLAHMTAESGLSVADAQRSGQGSDNLIPRPYAPGDSMRRIHWRASARLGDLMVREEEQEASPAAVIVFDRAAARWSPTAVTVGGDDAFEAAVTLCASAAWRLWLDGHIVEVVDAAGVRIATLGQQAATAQDDREELLRAFTSIVAHGNDSLSGLGEHLGHSPTGTLMIVTGLLTTGDTQTLSGLARRGRLPLLFASRVEQATLQSAANSGWRAAALQERADVAWMSALSDLVEVSERA
ncbi:MAG: DUF58 domain-containing protein, partial [Microbacterium sp.]